ncbi:MAG: hypothetical protein OXC09_12235 [Truepera sp.]|nr:hypothetical protein [Truepera sp.]
MSLSTASIQGALTRLFPGRRAEQWVGLGALLLGSGSMVLILIDRLSEALISDTTLDRAEGRRSLMSAGPIRLCARRVGGRSAAAEQPALSHRGGSERVRHPYPR